MAPDLVVGPLFCGAKQAVFGNVRPALYQSLYSILQGDFLCATQPSFCPPSAWSLRRAPPAPRSGVPSSSGTAATKTPPPPPTPPPQRKATPRPPAKLGS